MTLKFLYSYCCNFFFFFITQVFKLPLINPEEWLHFPLVRHPDKSRCGHSLYTVGLDIGFGDAILIHINLSLRRADRTPRGATKRTITLLLQDNCLNYTYREEENLNFGPDFPRHLLFDFSFITQKYM